MRVALAQYPVLFFQRFSEWRMHIAEWVQEAVHAKAQLLVFPEYGSMALSSLLPTALQSDLHGQIIGLQTMLNDFIDVFSTLAKRQGVMIVAPSIPFQAPGGAIHNRAWVFGPSGFGHQDKWIMTRFEHETWGIQAGPRRLAIFNSPRGRFGIQICYDVEFPLASHWLAAHGAQLILAPSCTETLRGATRVHVGARARALENQCFVAVSQTIGEAPWSPAVDLNYGWAAVYTPADTGMPEEGILVHGQVQEPGWVYQTLDFRLIEQVRTEGQVFNFKDYSDMISQSTFPEMTIETIQI